MKVYLIIYILISTSLFSYSIEASIKNDNIKQYTQEVDEITLEHLELAIENNSPNIINYIVNKKPELLEIKSEELNPMGYSDVSILTKEVLNGNFLKASYLKSVSFDTGDKIDLLMGNFSKEDFDNLILSVHPVITGFHYSKYGYPPVGVSYHFPVDLDLLASALLSPIETIDKIFDYLPQVKETVGEDNYYNALHIYLEAISKIDYTKEREIIRGVSTNTKDLNIFSDYNDTGRYINDSDKLSKEEYNEKVLIRAQSFFEEMGLFATSLFIKKTFDDLYENKDKNNIANSLYEKYSNRLIPIYNNFVADWNKKIPVKNTNLSFVHLTFLMFKYPVLNMIEYLPVEENLNYNDYYIVYPKGLILNDYINNLSSKENIDFDYLEKSILYSNYYYKLDALGVESKKISELYSFELTDIPYYNDLENYEMHIRTIEELIESGLIYLALRFLNDEIEYFGNIYSYTNLNNYPYLDYTVLTKENNYLYDKFIDNYDFTEKKFDGISRYYINEEKYKEYEKEILKKHKLSIEKWNENFFPREALLPFEGKNLLPIFAIGPLYMTENQYINLFNDYAFFASQAFENKKSPINQEEIEWIYDKLIMMKPTRHTLYLNYGDFYHSLDKEKYKIKRINLYEKYIETKKDKKIPNYIKEFLEDNKK